MYLSAVRLLAVLRSYFTLIFQASEHLTMYSSEVRAEFTPTKHSRLGCGAPFSAEKNLLTGSGWARDSCRQTKIPLHFVIKVLSDIL